MKANHMPFTLTGVQQKATVIKHLQNLLVIMEGRDLEYVSGGVNIDRKETETGFEYSLTSDLKFQVVDRA